MTRRSSSNVRYAELIEDLEASFLAIATNPKSVLKSKNDLIKGQIPTLIISSNFLK